MKASDLAALPIAAGAALRQRRLFHPSGVLANGTIERLSPPNEGLPIESGDVVGRISKAVGTPGALPDAAGLAWRMSPAPFAATPWDVLLVSAGFGSSAMVPNRVALRAVTSWSEAVYSSLLPLRYEDELWWIRARLTTPVGGSGLSLRAVHQRINGDGVDFDIEQACGGGEFTPLAALRLTEVVPLAKHAERDISFDPVRHSAPEVRVWPEWLRNFRALAYRSSREGRDGES
ncbi:phosphodiesterase [Mycolicibacterium sp. ELW1]|uniref:phosphodiesterase n=1 Tax=Mycobacteriaceae TaxID=1762 RepID=UPI0011ED194A|nr:phosphodiesterase [Mycobacterium sp. ELW1]QEN16556.1 phosphodiesterase [Mycobacterium sp. ELW1]